MKAYISTHIFPTEDEKKILRNLSSIFPEVSFKKEGELLVGETNNLVYFQNLLEKRRIRNTIEEILLKNYRNGRTYLLLNKQIKTVNVYENHPLGPIKLEIECSKEQIRDIVWKSS